MWPTPTKNGNNRRSTDGPKHGNGLATAIKLLPTPTTQDAKNNGSISQQNRNTPPLNAVIKSWKGEGELNPNFEEAMMGYPDGWTDLSVSNKDLKPHNGFGDDWEEHTTRLSTREDQRRKRIFIIGNSLVPQIPALIFKRIKELIEE